MSTNKQLWVEVMTVIVLGGATFVAMSSERPVDGAGRSGMIATPVLNTAELPQDQVRDDLSGR